MDETINLWYFVAQRMISCDAKTREQEIVLINGQIIKITQVFQAVL